MEHVAGRELRITNRDKVLYPSTGTTKGTVIDYYLAVAPALLPLAEGRPVTRKRWVNGVGTAAEPAASFFRKDLEDGAPGWIPRMEYRHKTSTNTYPLAEEPAVLAWFAQLAALELHVPQWRVGSGGERLNPDRLVLDLDPGPGAGLAECVEVAWACKDLLADMGLTSVPVTSGSKGIHLYAELDGTITSDDASAVAKRLAEAIATERPDLATANMRKDQRRGKVLIDWSQNNAAKTTVCPYSLRGRARPTVAAPRTWEELRDPSLGQLTFRQVLSRLGDGINPMVGFSAGRSNGRSRRTRRTKSVGDDDEPAGRLSPYITKRDPARTPEPFPGAAPNPRSAPRFVIQRHDARRLHWDFRLEHDGVLASWAVPKGPPLAPGTNRLAVRTEDHPVEYADFEGVIPKGEYGGGAVTIWDAGTTHIEKWETDEVIATLHPRPGGGLGSEPRRYALIRTGSQQDPAAPNWLLHLMKNQRIAPAREIPTPMLATRADPRLLGRIHHDPGGWSYEMKWDGIRAVAANGPGGVRVMSRGGHDITATYPELAELSTLGRDGLVVDGEIVALNARGVPDFGTLQRRMNLAAGRVAAERARTPVFYLVFDLLAGPDGPVLEKTYEQRRVMLLEHLRVGTHVLVPAAEPADVEEALAVSAELGLEGIVAKRKDSPYLPGARSEDWVKLKHELHQEVIVIGWRPSARGRLASLLLGVHDDGELRYAGRVGTGFSESARRRIPALLAPEQQNDTPAVGVPAEVRRDARWVTPLRVGEVRYSEVTANGTLRHPVWRGWRPEKTAAAVTWEVPPIPGGSK